VSRIAQFDGVDAAALPARPLHLAIGIFDGVHLGHRAVIEAAVRAARASGGVAAVLTFSPHPSVVLRPGQATQLLQPSAAKALVLERLGVEAMIVEPFTPAFALIDAEDFVPWLKQHLPHLVEVYVGENWRFGHNRRGDVALLTAEAKRHGLEVFSAPRVQATGEPISSSRIRSLLTAGDIAGANALLGYSYFSTGTIAPGKRLGRTIGFPTLNLPWKPELRPRLGVYIARVSGAMSSTSLPAVANYGLRPTVEQSTEPRLEVHVLGTCPYDAGDEVTVEWLHFLRPEMKFSGLDELRSQIARDLDSAVAWFSR
jgi:riboflavin kinase/FMN adenylyltransferase